MTVPSRWRQGDRYLDRRRIVPLRRGIDVNIRPAPHLKTKATKNDPRARYSWKWTIITALYERGFSGEDILSIYRLVDWLMQLPEDLTKRFIDDLIVYEEGKKMSYITSAERIGIEKGMKKGMLNEAREMVLEALNIKFSDTVPADAHSMINALNDRGLLKRLLRIAIQSESLEVFTKIMHEIIPESMVNEEN